ncbi:MAG: DUF3450 family protein [Bdellovibrionales bacterium]
MIIYLMGLMLIAAQAEPIQLNKIGAEIVFLRGEIEQLNREIESAQAQAKAEIEAPRGRWVEVDAQIQKEKLKNLQLKARLQVLREETLPGVRATLVDAFKAWHERLSRYVKTSLPFQLEDRLLRLENWRQGLLQGTSSPSRLAQELWAITEKEIQLARRNEFVVMPLKVNGEIRTVELARFGMVSMVFADPQKRVGFSQFRSGAWTLNMTDNHEIKNSIERILMRFKKQMRHGWFEVPGLASPAAMEIQ